MKSTILLAASGAALLVAGCMMEEEPGLSAEAQSRLAAELEGYVPDGPAVSCVRSADLQGNRSMGLSRNSGVSTASEHGRLSISPCARCANRTPFQPLISGSSGAPLNLEGS